MIHPGDDTILNGLAESLEQTVLPALPRGTQARRNLQATIATIRRIAFAIPLRGAVLDADNVDMSATLVAITASSGTCPRATTEDAADCNLILQESLCSTLESLDADGDILLRSLFQRMIDRQLSLLPPPRPVKISGDPV